MKDIERTVDNLDEYLRETATLRQSGVFALINMVRRELEKLERVSQEWIDRNKEPFHHFETKKVDYYVSTDFLQNLLMPESKEITEDQAWELLKEKYEWPWDDLRYTVMQQLEEGTAEAKMANLGYFEVEVDGIKYHVHEDAHTRIYDEAYEQGRSDSEREHEGDLPVIPRHVADCIESAGSNRESNKDYVIRSIIDQYYEGNFEPIVYNWFGEKGNLLKFYRAVDNGYTVDEGQKCYALVKGHEIMDKSAIKFWNYSLSGSRLVVSSIGETREYGTQLTKDEWNEMGVNDGNADFVKVEELEE